MSIAQSAPAAAPRVPGQPALSSAEARTRQRLLEAAAAVFAEQGFRCTTVRAICARARANVAAVNYHFGDKQTLYREVLAHAYQLAVERYPPDLGLAPGAGAEEKLEAFVRSFLMRLLADDVAAHLGKLMAREMIEPSAALEHVIERAMRPMFQRLLQIVRELAGRGAGDAHVERCALSVAGQCLFYRHCIEVLRRGWPAGVATPQRIEELTQHITRLSLAGIRAGEAPALKRKRRSKR